MNTGSRECLLAPCAGIRTVAHPVARFRILEKAVSSGVERNGYVK